MNNPNLHIVCLEAPAPPDYGGAIDMYYKIVALAETGKNIILHYFDYHQGRNVNKLDRYCHQIYSYKREKIPNLLFQLPFIVSSRINKQLIDRLNKDDNPILLEGIHCMGIIPYLKNKGRKIVVRIHNNEAVYYKQLAKAETNFYKKLYFQIESQLLQKFQQQLTHQAGYAFLSVADKEMFQKKYGLNNSSFIPCFTAWSIVKSKTGSGQYCLYHGNLSVSENEKSAVWLIENIFSKINIPFIIAGKHISKRLFNLAKKHAHIQLITDPDNELLTKLIQEAHINVLPSMNNTGVKLKLLHALFEGRFCITNTNGIEGSKIGSGVFIVDTAVEVIKCIQQLIAQPFTKEQLQQRQALLQLYDNKLNAQKLSALLY